MDKIECQWCRAQNDSGKATCDTCGAPLDEQYKVTDGGWTEVPQLRDLTRFGFSESTCQVDGGIVPVAELALAEGNAVFFEHHVVLWKEPSLAISVMDSGGGIKRMVGGMPRILNVATGPGRIAVSRDAAAFAIGFFVEAFSGRPGLIGFTWNDCFDTTAGEELADRFVAVSLVAGNLPGPADVAWPTHGVHHVVELGRFVRLARGEGDGEHKALSVSNHVEF